MNETTYLIHAYLNALVGKAAFPTITDGYLCLFTADPGLAGSLASEVSGGAYVRLPIKAKLGSPSGGAMTNTLAITFPTATLNWGTITHIGIADALTAGTGNLLLWRAMLPTSQYVGAGQVLEIPIGSLIIRRVA